MPAPNETFTCNACYDSYNHSDLRLDAGRGTFRPVCPTCFDRLFDSCVECSERRPRADFSRIRVGEESHSICNSCRDENYRVCRDCDHYHLMSESVLVGGIHYCPTCAANYVPCEGCATPINRNFNNGPVCNACVRGAIGNYSSKVTDFVRDPFKSVAGRTKYYRADRLGGKGAIRYFGVELEVEVNERNNPERLSSHVLAYRVRKAFDWNGMPNDFIHCKSDSSLTNGFEIVSCPATIEYHKSGIWDKFFDTYREKQILCSYFTSTCGMHVHISRDTIGRMQLGKLIRFITHRRNRDFISQIAQRGSNRFNDFTREKRITQWNDQRWIQNEGHYTAVNLVNPYTVEIRLFKGTLKKESFFKNLEFCQALVDFCDTGVSSMSDVNSPDAFCKYVQQYAKEFPYLYAYLVKYKYCTLKSKPMQKKRGRKPKVAAAAKTPKTRRSRRGAAAVPTAEQIVEAVISPASVTVAEESSSIQATEMRVSEATARQVVDAIDGYLSMGATWRAEEEERAAVEWLAAPVAPDVTSYLTRAAIESFNDGTLSPAVVEALTSDINECSEHERTYTPYGRSLTQTMQELQAQGLVTSTPNGHFVPVIGPVTPPMTPFWENEEEPLIDCFGDSIS